MKSFSSKKRALSPEHEGNDTPAEKFSSKEHKKLKILQKNTNVENKKTPKPIQKPIKQKLVKSNTAFGPGGKRTSGTNMKQFNRNNTNVQVSWKELKERKKTLKQARKQKKNPGFDMTTQAKKLYEIAKQKRCPKKKREETVSKLYTLLKGHLKEFVYKHDMTRIVQIIIKVSPESTRYDVWCELKPEALKMLLSTYAAHTVISMLELGGQSVRKEMAGLLKGHLLELLKNKVASVMIGHIYKTFCTPEEKSCMRQELSGFRDDKNISKLLETIETQGCVRPESAASNFVQSLVECVRQEEEISLMISTKATLHMLIEKDLAGNTLVQSVLCDYLMKCSSTDREEFINNLQPTLEHILNTGLDSFYAVMLFVEYVWFGSSKERKWVTKQLHSRMPDICHKNYCYLLIMVVFECVDDTVLLRKTLLKDIIQNVRHIAENSYGWKIIMHILSPRNPRHFSSSYVNLLKLGDTIAVKKKSSDVRKAEILEPFIAPLLEDIAQDLPYWISNGRRAVLCFEVICLGKGTLLENVLSTIAEFVRHDKPGFVSDKGPEFNPRLEWLLKQLIKSDSQRFKDTQVTFSSLFLSTLTEEDIKLWVQRGAGAFLFVKLIETGIPSVLHTVKQLFTPDVRALIEDGASGEVLRNKLE